jgi:electron transfer flavoprotein alpha subunit
MKEIFALVEHRQGTIRDITFELLTAASVIANKSEGKVSALLLGSGVDGFVDQLKPWANEIIQIDDTKLEYFNADAYQKVLASLIRERKPWLTMIPQSGFGMDLAPSLAIALEYPLITDSFEIHVDSGELTAVRQLYGGKVNSWVKYKDETGYLMTIRASAFTAEEKGLSAEIVKVDSPLTEEIAGRKFIEYVEAAVGDVDISQADIVIGIGRGIKEKENLPVVQELADSIGGVLACSRPVVDAGWLPKDRQVGSSGKTIKPKLYLALGISGAFQHTAGMKGADLVVAVNKDCNAPIFGIADYGIIGDLFKVVPTLKEKINELKG